MDSSAFLNTHKGLFQVNGNNSTTSLSNDLAKYRFNSEYHTTVQKSSDDIVNLAAELGVADYVPVRFRQYDVNDRSNNMEFNLLNTTPHRDLRITSPRPHLRVDTSPQYQHPLQSKLVSPTQQAHFEENRRKYQLQQELQQRTFQLQKYEQYKFQQQQHQQHFVNKQQQQLVRHQQQRQREQFQNVLRQYESSFPSLSPVSSHNRHRDAAIKRNDSAGITYQLIDDKPSFHITKSPASIYSSKKLSPPNKVKRFETDLFNFTERELQQQESMLQHRRGHIIQPRFSDEYIRSPSTDLPIEKLTEWNRVDMNLHIKSPFKSGNAMIYNDNRKPKQRIGNSLYQSNPVLGLADIKSFDAVMKQCRDFMPADRGTVTGYFEDLPKVIQNRIRALENISTRRNRLRQLLEEENDTYEMTLRKLGKQVHIH